MPTTPREYLSELAPGTGQSRRTSSKVSRSTTGRTRSPSSGRLLLPFWGPPTPREREEPAPGSGKGRLGPSSRPMSTTVSRPTAASVPGIRCTGLATPNVTVSSANTAAPSRTSPAGSAPLRRSTATTPPASGRFPPARQVHGHAPRVLGDPVRPVGPLAGEARPTADAQQAVHDHVGL